MLDPMVVAPIIVTGVAEFVKVRVFKLPKGVFTNNYEAVIVVMVVEIVYK